MKFVTAEMSARERENNNSVLLKPRSYVTRESYSSTEGNATYKTVVACGEIRHCPRCVWVWKHSSINCFQNIIMFFVCHPLK